MLSINKITIEKLKKDKFSDEFPEFYELKNIIENNNWHNNESTFDHTLNVLKNYQKFLLKCDKKVANYLNKRVDVHKRKELIYLAIFLHDLGKKETIIKNGEESSFRGHEKISVLKARKVLKKFNLSAEEKGIVLGIIKKHSDLHAIVEADNGELVIQYQKLVKSCPGYIIDLVILVMMDTLNGYLKKTMPEKYKFRINFYKDKIKYL